MPDCGKKIPPPFARISPGGDATRKDFPWQVRLALETVTNAVGSEPTKKYEHICGGSIVSPIHILTAAKCVDGRDLNSLKIVADVKIPPSDAKLTDAGYDASFDAECIMLPDTPDTYVPRESTTAVTKWEDNDIAVITLTKAITSFKSLTVAPVCLKTPDDPADEDEMLVSGWGEKAASLDQTLKFEKVLFRTIDVNAKCKTSVLKADSLPGVLQKDKKICAVKETASGPQTTGSVACDGDVGGMYLFHGLRVKMTGDFTFINKNVLRPKNEGQFIIAAFKTAIIKWSYFWDICIICARKRICGQEIFTS